MSKKLYALIEDGENTDTLLLSEEQAAIFKWLNDRN